jgi:hypothetical protein
VLMIATAGHLFCCIHFHFMLKYITSVLLHSFPFDGQVYDMLQS